MLQLVYISSSREPVVESILQDILTVSRRNNARCDVTGLLVAGGRRFLQVLEGPDQAVLGTYARIQNDDRHRAFVLLSSRPIATRDFGSWNMAFRAGGEAKDGDLRDVVEELIEPLSDRNLIAQFRSFAALHDKAA
jgi:hypothetical protein